MKILLDMPKSIHTGEFRRLTHVDDSTLATLNKNLASRGLTLTMEEEGLWVRGCEEELSLPASTLITELIYLLLNQGVTIRLQEELVALLEA